MNKYTLKVTKEYDVYADDFESAKKKLVESEKTIPNRILRNIVVE